MLSETFMERVKDYPALYNRELLLFVNLCAIRGTSESRHIIIIMITYFENLVQLRRSQHIL